MPKLLHTNNLSVLPYIRRVAASIITTQLFCIYYKTVKIRQYCSCSDLQINKNTSFLKSVLILWDKVTWNGHNIRYGEEYETIFSGW